MICANVCGICGICVNVCSVCGVCECVWCVWTYVVCVVCVVHVWGVWYVWMYVNMCGVCGCMWCVWMCVVCVNVCNMCGVYGVCGVCEHVWCVWMYVICVNACGVCERVWCVWMCVVYVNLCGVCVWGSVVLTWRSGFWSEGSATGPRRRRGVTSWKPAEGPFFRFWNEDFMLEFDLQQDGPGAHVSPPQGLPWSLTAPARGLPPKGSGCLACGQGSVLWVVPWDLPVSYTALSWEHRWFPAPLLQRDAHVLHFNAVG